MEVGDLAKDSRALCQHLDSIHGFGVDTGHWSSGQVSWIRYAEKIDLAALYSNACETKVQMVATV
jgi:hypothetical protein